MTRPPERLTVMASRRPALSVLMHAVQAYARMGLKNLGIVDDARIHARACWRLEADLLLYPWVAAVTVQDSDGRRREGHVGGETLVMVLLSGSPTAETEREINRCVSAVNLRYGLSMRALSIEQRHSGSYLR